MIDRRLSLLLRAAVRYDMVERGEMDLATAFDELLPAFYEAAGDPLYLEIFRSISRHPGRKTKGIAA